MIDFIRYNDPSLLWGNFLANLVDHPENYMKTISPARLTRCELGLSGGGAPDCEMLFDRTFELPAFNIQKLHKKVSAAPQLGPAGPQRD